MQKVFKFQLYFQYTLTIDLTEAFSPSVAEKVFVKNVAFACKEKVFHFEQYFQNNLKKPFLLYFHILFL